MGLGFIVLTAAEAAAAGLPLNEIITLVQEKHLLPKEALTTVEITPILGANLGPGAVGFACVSARPQSHPELTR